MRDKVTQTIYETIRTHGSINRNEHIVLGLSGGPDSVCLFDVLTGLAAEIGFTMETVHVNHKIRPGAAEHDQAFVENICRERGIKCTVTVEHCEERAKEWGLTSEEAGRRIRYDAFDRAAAAYSADHPECRGVKIALAHNMNDQAETVMFRILRGTGLDGLAGIDYCRKSPAGFDIVRPLLDCAREDIEHYCGEKGLDPCIDKTNSEPLYTRNKIRLGLLPYIRENFNENITGTLTRLAATAREDRDFLEAEAEKTGRSALKAKEEGIIVFDRGLLKEAPAALRHRVIIGALGELGLTQDITSVHLRIADAVICGERASAKAEFHGGYSVDVSYGEVICSAPEAEEIRRCGFEIDIEEGNSFAADKSAAAFDLDVLCGEHGITEDEALNGAVEFRTRRTGDRIQLPGMKGRKKIQDLFVDMKVPAAERDAAVMACIGHEVLWIPGDAKTGRRPRYSGCYRAGENTKRLIVFRIRPTS
ncbi:MAG: tRNA lysidine(34) synthetase TilS [Eubacteriaceae bacterium]|jgi:tRNA(Ile)-lysidine synthase|nr:tRNA lysidine(34) synthetase TilS [Eubacteriaceae bacterium]